MAEENVEMVRGGYEAFSCEGPKAVIALVAPEIEWAVPAEHPEGGIHHGPEGVENYLNSLLEAFSSIEPHIGQIYAVGDDKVFVEVTFVGKAKVGMEVELTEFDIWTMRDGLAIRREAYGTEAEALEAAGLSA